MPITQLLASNLLAVTQDMGNNFRNIPWAATIVELLQDRSLVLDTKGSDIKDKLTALRSGLMNYADQRGGNPIETTARLAAHQLERDLRLLSTESPASTSLLTILPHASPVNQAYSKTVVDLIELGFRPIAPQHYQYGPWTIAVDTQTGRPTVYSQFLHDELADHPITSITNLPNQDEAIQGGYALLLGLESGMAAVKIADSKNEHSHPNWRVDATAEAKSALEEVRKLQPKSAAQQLHDAGFDQTTPESGIWKLQTRDGQTLLAVLNDGGDIIYFGKALDDHYQSAFSNAVRFIDALPIHYHTYEAEGQTALLYSLNNLVFANNDVVMELSRSPDGRVYSWYLSPLKALDQMAHGLEVFINRQAPDISSNDALRAVRTPVNPMMSNPNIERLVADNTKVIELGHNHGQLGYALMLARGAWRQNILGTVTIQGLPFEVRPIPERMHEPVFNLHNPRNGQSLTVHSSRAKAIFEDGDYGSPQDTDHMDPAIIASTLDLSKISDIEEEDRDLARRGVPPKQTFHGPRLFTRARVNATRMARTAII